MPLSTCTVSGVLYDATGAALANEPLTIIPRDWAVGADGLVLPETVTTTTDGSGNISVVLGRPAIYTVQTNRPNVLGRRTFVISVPDAATADIELIADFTNVAQQTAFLDGTAANPAFRFVNDVDTGLFLKASNTIGFSTAGTERVSITNNGLTTLEMRVDDGSAAAPAVRFSSDLDTGLYRIGANNIGVATNGTEVARFTTSGAQVTGTISGTAVTQTSIDNTANRLTKVGDFGLGGAPILYDSTSPFNIPLVDATHFIGNSSVSNVPTDAPVGSTVFVGMHARLGSARQAQMLFQLSGSTHAYWRLNNSAWSDWFRFYDTGNLLGTVSQSGGVPTGAVIERGSNANGEYVRFADGTQICWHVVDLDGLAPNTASGSLFRLSAGLGPYAYPAAFSGSVRHAEVSLHGSDNAVIRNGSVGARLRRGSTVKTIEWATVDIFTTSSDPGTAGEITRISLFAIGRWF